ncbi:hypothetical protein FRC05_002310 [Tulasnella sp. 425]|nr:hypothetical protein FRC05_002310 [Tulasnella sp. 425]
MHSLWQIPELVHLILKLLGLKDQGTTAQVCQILWMNVLPLIWRHVDHLHHVVRLLPEDAVTTYTKENTITGRIKRTLHDADWERALLHTQHTTEIGILTNDFLLLDFLSNRPSTPVFPALRRIRIGFMGEVPIPSVELMRVFLPSNVSSIELRIYRRPKALAEAILNSIANDISLPELTRLSVTTSFVSLGQAISQVILSHRSIQKLTVRGARPSKETAQILRSAGELPHLDHISLTHSSGSGINQAPNIRILPRGSLGALTKIKVAGDPAFVDAVLGLPVAKNMRSLYFRLTASAKDETQFADCLHSIGQFTRLKYLELRLEIKVPWSAVSMFVGCRELEVFRVVAIRGGSLDITEADLERMADALPRLQELTLNSLSEHVQGISHIPIHHLHRIATRFRTLRKLCVSVDATAEGNPTFDWTTPAAVENEALEELDVASSQVDSEAKLIAAIFRAWWPKLRLVKWSDDSHIGPVWGEVNALLVKGPK